jgi:rod shape determining protein RodA
VGTSIKISNNDFMNAHIGVFDIRNIRRIDPVFTLITAALIAFGLLVLLSATHSGSVQSGSLASQTFKLMSSGNVIKQLVGITVGTMLALLLISLDYRSLVAWAPVFFVSAIVLLVLVLLIGTEAKGGKRWINVGPVNFQPSEVTKLALIYMMAWYFTLIGPRIKRLPFFLLSFAIPAIPAVLILKQPNLGTTLTLFPIMFVMLFVAGCRFWHIALLVIIGLVTAPVAFSQLKDYQKERVLSFVQGSEEEAHDSGYHTLQTMITVGSGQMHGKGYLKGTQTHLSFLPEHHTDFIFAVLAEEKGFVGAILGVGLLLIFFLRGLGLARECPDMTGTLLAVGCVTLLAFHSFINIAITIGILPVTGIPLPFFSYGPSFYLTAMMCVGTLLSVHVRRGYFD